jgi:hypothetical protein
MNDVLLMNAEKAFNELLEHVFSDIFLQSSSLSDIVE